MSLHCCYAKGTSPILACVCLHGIMECLVAFFTQYINSIFYTILIVFYHLIQYQYQYPIREIIHILMWFLLIIVIDELTYTHYTMCAQECHAQDKCKCAHLLTRCERIYNGMVIWRNIVKQACIGLYMPCTLSAVGVSRLASCTYITRDLSMFVNEWI